MEKKELLNEENYQKSKKKITRIALIILIVALLIGGGLIALGIIKTNTSKKETELINQERYEAAYKETEEQKLANEIRLNEIEEEKASLNKAYDQKEQECDSLSMSDKDWFSKVNQCEREARAIKSEITTLETEAFKLNNASYKVSYKEELSKNYIFISVLGGILIVAGCGISLSIYLIAKRRDIAAFTIQQTMPLAQEGIEKMAPTVGNAAGTIGKSIAKSIASGIKEGLKEEDTDKKTK